MSKTIAIDNNETSLDKYYAS